ncbi:hypothetical protein HR17_05745 [Porphyromonas gulae]|uniref:PGN_0703 family putative restriction endonuclease n=1 Tax=Porphyromonas gulae TaxID=111105 RepID=UPI00052BFAA6|nr:hypothetical protein [Porphyromonas gulae]KGN68722.1 hypothetical protein HR09_06970 [Porphyromonas gulae]KGN74281.1 hypothetical protein HR17_05745 [Porphyromonas gulae]KGO04592.1 hypothetical protein HR16_04430 [Porphyromonas gulae]
MSRNYQAKQQERQKKLRLEYLKMKGDRHILDDGWDNIFEPIRKCVVESRIKWWRGEIPTGSMCSSQVACINHLFSFRDNKDAVLAILNALPGYEGKFEEVEKYKGHHISFEEESDYARKRMGEDPQHPTQIDALILAKDTDGKRWIIPVEWKYTESYGPKSLYKEERGNRYNGLISTIGCFKEDKIKVEDLKNSLFYINPFHQMMRQTLWAKLLTSDECTEKELKADKYLHVLVVPDANERLYKPERRDKTLNRLHDLERWEKEYLADPLLFIRIDPQKLFENVLDQLGERELKEYLSKRYWGDNEYK